ncbi:MAG: hydrogenase 4 subunit F [Methanosarcinaceae archaeon]|nr:hydrogenase 4 subunit F [Methanosarcinaceae archaeon]
MIQYLLLIPVLTAVMGIIAKTQKQIETISLVGSTATLAVGLKLVFDVFNHGTITTWENMLFADPLSAFLVLIVSVVGFIISLYSIGYMGHEIKHDMIDLKRLKIYYVFFHLFMFTMLLVGVTNNLVLWVAIEMTTLFSVPLITIYTKKTSIEAAWKYLIICSVGITFALFGTILTYYAAVQVLGEAGGALDWASLLAVANQFDPTLMKIAFIFIIVGYGTKVGFAPMHTWLPDAHSEAPSPVSALLSGVLLNCAMYGIIRFHTITSVSVGTGFSNNLLIMFGLLSLGIATPFIIMQSDYKRLLAYSSVEHMGIIALGFGFGGTLGIFGALLHMFNHAVTKSLMFSVAGNILQKYETKRIDEVSGVVKSMPYTGPMLVLGGLAITGSPPFSIFLSEFTILAAGFSRGYIITSVVVLLFIIMIFAGFFNHINRMAFSTPPEGVTTGDVSRLSLGAMAILMVFIIVLGVYIPHQFSDMIMQVVNIVNVVR